MNGSLAANLRFLETVWSLSSRILLRSNIFKIPKVSAYLLFQIQFDINCLIAFIVFKLISDYLIFWRIRDKLTRIYLINNQFIFCFNYRLYRNYSMYGPYDFKSMTVTINSVPMFFNYILLYIRLPYLTRELSFIDRSYCSYFYALVVTGLLRSRCNYI